jgi:hypothetical protein
MRLSRLSSLNGPSLALTSAHETLSLPRRGRIRWSTFDAGCHERSDISAAAKLWRDRAVAEMCSLVLFTELASCIQRIGAPLDWSGAFARMIADEVRHTDLCLRMSELLSGDATLDVEDARLGPRFRAETRAELRHTVMAAFCIGETLSGHMFRRARAAATVPVARDVLTAIVVDETFHAEFGWELFALLMRHADDAAFEAERAALAATLPTLMMHYAHMCFATKGRAWAFESPEMEAGVNFGHPCAHGLIFHDSVAAVPLATLGKSEGTARCNGASVRAVSSNACAMRGYVRRVSCVCSLGFRVHLFALFLARE